MLRKIRARFIGLDLPQPKDRPHHEVENHLTEALRRRRDAPDRLAEMFDAGLGPGDIQPDEFEALLSERELSEEDSARIQRHTLAYLNRRKRRLQPLAHIKPDERDTVLHAAHNGQAFGVIARDPMEERIAALHAAFPWFAAASTAVMTHMRQRTSSAAAAFHTPPLLLLGPPGIGKSSWARALAAAFEVPSVEIDVGATNGATFALAGAERGWGSSHSGRVVQTMLQQSCANPMVIIDEIDKIPEQVHASRGGALPGALEVLKSMIEPTTARHWPCPSLQIPFDLTGVSWVMTTNSISALPEAFLDRCKVVTIPAPTQEQLIEVACRMVAGRFRPEDQSLCNAILTDLIRTRSRLSRRTSLRSLERLCNSLQERIEAPRLQ